MQSALSSLTRGLLGLALIALSLLPRDAVAMAPKPVAATPPAAADIELGLQCWTFRNYTLRETVDKAHALGIRKLQAYPGQRLGGGLAGKFGPGMSADEVAAVKAWLAERDISIVSFGVANPEDAAAWKQLGPWAKSFGISTIAIELPREKLAAASKSAAAEGLRLALHNHPRPSRYADPSATQAALKELGPKDGLCADTGHWTRNGHDPVASLRLFAGRLVEVHFKDISEPAVRAHDMPWGTGIGRASLQVAELKRQGFKGVVFIEYEFNGPRLEQEVAMCIAWFRSALVTGTEQLEQGLPAAPGFTRDVSDLWRDPSAANPARWPSPSPLFKPDLSNAEFAPGSWVWEGDTLVAKGGGDLWTKASYGNFALSLEFRCEKDSNSGVFLRCSDTVEWLHSAIEVQILQGAAEKPSHVLGSIFDIQAPTVETPIEPGTWHRMLVQAHGSKIQVQIDGRIVQTIDLTKWTKAGQNPDGTPNKFKRAYADMAREGRIGLQYHGSPIAFRNILVEPLRKPPVARGTWGGSIEPDVAAETIP